MPKDAQPKPGTRRKDALRPYNERLFLSLIRSEGKLSKAELRRASGLSAQSATVIVNRLVEDGLLLPGDAVKGKVGQPSTPYSLNPDGALSIGIKVGRRSLEVACMGFDYTIKQRIVRRYDFPHLATIRKDILRDIETLFRTLSQAQRNRMTGIGIALPDDLSAWETTVGAPKGAMSDWSKADLPTDLQGKFDLPVVTLNDVSAACLAEIAVGNMQRYQSFAYFYVGTFIGGGIAIGGQLYIGHHSQAGAFASIPTGAVSTGMARQLLEGASLHYLEESAIAAGLQSDCFYNEADLDPAAQAEFENWLMVSAPQIAFAVVSAQAFLDPEAIIIDSSLAPGLTGALIDAIRQAITSHYDHRGLAEMTVVPGEIGVSARAIGSGIVPFLSEFALEPGIAFNLAGSD